MKATIEQQAAMGRMLYALRSTVNGLRQHGEDPELILRAVLQEAMNLCLVKYHGRSLTSAQADFSIAADEIWELIELNNPQLLEHERNPNAPDPDRGGN